MRELKFFEESFNTNQKMVVIRRELVNDDNEIEEGDFHVKQKFLTYLIQALQLLAINEKMKTKIFVEHTELNDYLKELSENKANKVHKDVVKACKETRWILTELDEKDEYSTKTESKTDEQHIMISYNRMSRGLCLKIKEDLEKLGLRVWIDVTGIHGN